MGCFGYICRGCGTSIRGDYLPGGEKCILIHVRHGEELGRVEGHYNEYGGVTEQNKLPEEERFRGNYDGINSHNEIHCSEFGFADSSGVEKPRLIDGKPTYWYSYSTMKKFECLKTGVEYNWFETSKEFEKFPLIDNDIKSGVAAWHSKCYHKATQEQREDLTPSYADPNQSCGKVRKKFI